MTCTALSVLVAIATAQCVKLNETLEGIVLNPNRVELNKPYAPAISIMCKSSTGDYFYFGTIKSTGCIKYGK